MCPTVRPTRGWAGPRAAGGRAWARSRRCGWWGWWRAGTHAIVDAAQGPYSSGEQTLARQLAREDGPLGPGVLLLADRLFVGAELWRQLARTGADLVWRVKCGSKTAPKLPVDQVLSDGSWLSRLYAASDRRRRHPITVRVIEYTLTDPGRRTSTDRYRLVTTILDPAAAPAHELAALYTERWEIEMCQAQCTHMCELAA
jgi:hypothetical protein